MRETLPGNVFRRFNVIVGICTVAVTGVVACSAPASPSPTAIAAIERTASPAATQTPATISTPVTVHPPRAEERTGWVTYASQRLQVSLQYPGSWQPKQGYEERHEGPDGFFDLGAATGAARSGTYGIDELAQSDANHKLKPYGSEPTVESLQVEGQEARLILPSEDQPGESTGLAAMIVRAPRPIRLAGDEYHYLVLYADKDHIREIGITLRFAAVQ